MLLITVYGDRPEPLKQGISKELVNVLSHPPFQQTHEAEVMWVQVDYQYPRERSLRVVVNITPTDKRFGDGEYAQEEFVRMVEEALWRALVHVTPFLDKQRRYADYDVYVT